MGGSEGRRRNTVSLSGRNFSSTRAHCNRVEDSTAQHGMSFDDAGRIRSNSSHLQALMYPSRMRAATRALPSQRWASRRWRGGGVFRLSPDEPWRIVRTRWRIAGQVRGPVEGGGRRDISRRQASRLSGRHERITRQRFIADAGSNLIHRKELRYPGVQPIGERPADERG